MSTTDQQRISPRDNFDNRLRMLRENSLPKNLTITATPGAFDPFTVTVHAPDDADDAFSKALRFEDPEVVRILRDQMDGDTPISGAHGWAEYVTATSMRPDPKPAIVAIVSIIRGQGWQLDFFSDDWVWDMELSIPEATSEGIGFASVDGHTFRTSLPTPINSSWEPETYRRVLAGAGWTVLGPIPETFTENLVAFRRRP